MNTPMGSKKQQQKKASAKKGLRNVLAQPFKKYWPVLTDDRENSLEELLNRLLPGLRRESRAVPWAQLRNMDKAERLVAQKKARTETREANDGNSHAFFSHVRLGDVARKVSTEGTTRTRCCRKAVTMGVNAVTRDLEKNNLACVLLDSCVESLLVKHVVVMAQNKGIPVLLVPYLKKLTLANVGFASAAMGLKHVATESDHAFHVIYEEIVKLSPPVSSSEKCSSNESSNPKLTNQDSSEKLEMLLNENSSAKKFVTVSTNVYKYRKSVKERTFVPPCADVKVVTDTECTDFIAIGNDDVEMEDEQILIPRKRQRYMDDDAKDNENCTSDVIKSGDYVPFDSTNEDSSLQRRNHKDDKKNTKYLPLRVKRVQGNTNRIKATKTPKQKKK